MLEKVLETRTCSHCSTKFDITDVDVDFLTRLMPTIGGKTFSLPFPTECPECRKFARLSWRNEKKLYKRKCDKTGKDIVALFPPDSSFVIYDEKIWNSDGWDAKLYGKEYDFTRSFFEQFRELLQSVPLPSKSSVECENSEYCNACTALKNCYLCFSANGSENILYSVDIVRVNNSVDCFGIMECENCYECTVATLCYNVQFSYDIKNCRDSYFLLSCDGCTNCYGSFDLVNNQFYIYNTQYSKEEYFQKLREIQKLSIAEQKREFEAFYKGKYIKNPLPNIGSENVFSSENVLNSENVSHSRHVRGCRDIRYCQKMQVPSVALAMDYTGFGHNAEKIYYSQQVGSNAMNIYFSVGVFNEVSNIFYSAYCRGGTHDCFGCSGLKNSSYCILNKQYTKEEYDILVPQIIEKMMSDGEWGKFFPLFLSPFGYDDTVCQLLNPLSEEEARKQGYNWSGYEAPFPKAEKTIPASKLPDTIEGIPDDILNWAIECEVSGKPFRIIKQELEFYRKHNLPIPKKHPDQRYLDRLKWHVNY